MLTDIPGVRVGHWTEAEARTGCTVVLLPAGTTASGEVRGGAPGTREFELLRPERLVARIDAVVLAGGSAFGLAACDGVVRWCEERGVGLPTPTAVIPIVVGCVLFDLAVGDGGVRPGPDDGYAACVAATAGAYATGAVGAGTGATVAKWRGPGAARQGGIGTATARGPSGVAVAALIACNAWGEPRGEVAVAPPDPPALPDFATNTTIGVVVTNARIDKAACSLLAQSGHDGLARALHPVHSAFDGDAIVAAATGSVDPPAEGPVGVEVLRALATDAVERATRAAVPSPSRES
ncbi:MAG: P1 family peptidase [Acidimicrobiales bacterium]